MAKLNKYLTAVTAATGALLVSAGIAFSATLDFNGATPCVSTDAFVTLTIQGAATCSTTTAPTTGSQAIALQTSGLPSSMRADFGGTVSFVSIDMGDYNADVDNIFLEVFSAANISLGYVDLLRAGTSFAMDTLWIGVGGISYAIFGTNGSDLGYIAADNLTWRTDGTVVPVPAAGVLLLTGLGALGGLASRRRKLA